MKTPSAQDVQFSNITMEDGLSQTTVFSIAQDHQGFMWFGTEDGLNKYNGYDFRIYSHFPYDENTLSNNTILCLFVDKAGLLWIGTNDGGLNVYDRENDNFISFQNDPEDGNSISGDKVFTIFQDDKETIWIGTQTGLDKIVFEVEGPHDKAGELGKIRFHHAKASEDDPYSISYNHVRTIIQDKDGNMWFGTQGGGLNKMLHDYDDGKSEPIFIHYENDPDDPQSLSNNNVLSIYEDDRNNIWVATYGGGVNRFDKSTKKFERFEHEPENPSSISFDVVLCIYGDGSGNIWMGTYGGGLESLQAWHQPEGKIGYTFKHFVNDPSDDWSLSNNTVGTIFEDKFGVLWVGTFGGAINKYDTQKPKFEYFKHNPQNENSLPAEGVGTMFVDSKKILWVGTAGGGLTRIDRETGEYAHWNNNPADPNSFPHSRVTAIMEDSKGEFWIGTSGGGLINFDRVTKTWHQFVNDPEDETSLPHNVVRVIHEDNEGTLWIGTHGGGLSKMDRWKRTFIHFQQDAENPKSIYSNRVRAIHEDGNGVLWIANDVLSKFDKEREEFTHYVHDPNDRSSLASNSVRSIHEDSKGFLWVGTLRGGLHRFTKRNGRFEHWRLQEGLPNDVVYGVLGDQNENIWVSTNRGISMLHVKEDKFYNYDISDGLQSNEFSSGAYFKSTDGEMFFGGINGFNAFFPDSMKTNPYVPDVVITGFQIFNQEVLIGTENSPLDKAIHITDSLVLSYKDYIFSFDFAALHFSNPSKNQYAYKMTGFGDESASSKGGWQYVGTRYNATFTNLDPGSYTFSVKGSNNDGIWNEEPTSIHITILPPFWRTWWFYLLCVGIGMGAIGLLMKGREKVLVMRVHNLENKVSELEQDLKDQEEKFKRQEKDRNPFGVD
ncbi:MAG: hypothetical protein JKX73_10680 [Flavobacteriales bacterium]|nr:hypothetical protein [Flavobacteriales bacterium]